MRLLKILESILSPYPATATYEEIGDVKDIQGCHLLHKQLLKIPLATNRTTKWKVWTYA